MPSPQSLVVFVTLLFLLLVATPRVFDTSPVMCATISIALALAMAYIVERRIPHEADDDEDEITQEADAQSVLPKERERSPEASDY